MQVKVKASLEDGILEIFIGQTAIPGASELEGCHSYQQPEMRNHKGKRTRSVLK